LQRLVRGVPAKCSKPLNYIQNHDCVTGRSKEDTALKQGEGKRVQAGIGDNKLKIVSVISRFSWRF